MIGDNGIPETPEWTVTPHDETAYLMRSPANARRLLDAIARLERDPEFLPDGLSVEEKFPPGIILGEN